MSALSWGAQLPESACCVDSAGFISGAWAGRSPSKSSPFATVAAAGVASAPPAAAGCELAGLRLRPG